MENKVCSLSNEDICNCKGQDKVGVLKHIKTPLLGKKVKITAHIHAFRYNIPIGEMATIIDAVIWPISNKTVYGAISESGQFQNIGDDEFENPL